MYYSFYLNEKLLLDNWDKYNECNWLLKQLLMRDYEKSIDKKIDYYLANRNTKDSSNTLLAEYYEDYIDDYIYRKEMYEEFLELGEGNSVIAMVDFERNPLLEKYEGYLNNDSQLTYKFVNGTIRNRKMKKQLRMIEKVNIYASDIKAINKARKQFNLTQLQINLLCGLIFFSRMNNSRYCRVGTEFKFKQFKSCFKKTIKQKDIDAVLATGLFEMEIITKESADKMRKQKRYLNIRDERDYEYMNFDNKDEIAFSYKVTIDNNKLDLTNIAAEILPNYKVKYCANCGTEFIPTNNRQLVCLDCKKEVIKIKDRERKRKNKNI